VKKKSAHKKVQELREFWNRELWRTDINPLPPQKRFGFIGLRIIAIIIKGFKNDKCSIHAAALTNITLMSLVPFMAFIFAIAKGFYPPDKLNAEFAALISELPTGAKEVLNTLLEKVLSINVSAMSSVSMIIIVWTVISLMGKIEHTFNNIWGIKINRTFITKVKEYFFTLMIVPTIIVLSSSVTTALKNPRVTDSLKSYVGEAYVIYNILLIALAPMTIALAFTYLYKFLPNTKVKLIPAFIAGLVTAMLWMGVHWVYIEFQVGVANHNAIYGTFASVPLFLAWLYTSWMIILFGAEVSFAVQNHNTYEDENMAKKYSVTTKFNLAICLTRDIAGHFMKGTEWKSNEALNAIGIPVRLGNRVLKQLVDCHILKNVNDQEGEYLPAKDLQHLTLYDLHKALNGEKDSILDNIKSEDLLSAMAVNNSKLSLYENDLRQIKIYDLANDEI